MGSASSAAMFVHCITVTRIISFLFSRSSSFTRLYSFCLFFYVEQKAKCHKILGLKKWKLRILLLFKGSMGTMVLFDFAVCSNSGSHPFWLPCFDPRPNSPSTPRSTAMATWLKLRHNMREFSWVWFRTTLGLSPHSPANAWTSTWVDVSSGRWCGSVEMINYVLFSGFID